MEHWDGQIADYCSVDFLFFQQVALATSCQSLEKAAAKSKREEF